MYSLKPAHHHMPPPTIWNNNMPWSTSSSSYSDIVEFNGQPIAHCSQSMPNSIKNVFKRKSTDIDEPIMYVYYAAILLFLC